MIVLNFAVDHVQLPLQYLWTVLDRQTDTFLLCEFQVVLQFGIQELYISLFVYALTENQVHNLIK